MSRLVVVDMSPFLLEMVEDVVVWPEYVDYCIYLLHLIFLSSSLETLTLGALCRVRHDKLCSSFSMMVILFVVLVLIGSIDFCYFKIK